MSLVPSRTAAPVPKEREPIQLRLARLRREERASQPRPIPPPSLGLLLPSLPGTSATWRKSAGPAPPPSWTARSLEERRFVDSKAREKWLDRRRALLSTFEAPGSGANEAGGMRTVPALAEILRRKILEDLGRPSKQSLYLPFVHLLPNHVKIAMFETAALWHPLKERALHELLRDEDWDDRSTTEGSESQGELAGDAISASMGQDGKSDDGWGNDGDEAQQHGGAASWEGLLNEPTIASFAGSLTTLNLAFSSITLKCFRSIVLHDTSTRPLPSLPNLSILQLAVTPNLPFSQPFFDTFKPLVQLRHLSLAGKAVDGLTAVPTSVLLSRLAAATPTLILLDLSFLPLGSELDRMVKAVDWDVRWRDLRKLGVRMGEKDWEARERRRKDLGRAIALDGRSKPRAGIDIVT
ncbi:hypothetical protein P7C70_g3665, partial [Phenoliferia sp. Uapishka_3]